MLSLAHTATGSLIAVKIGNPILAIPLILISHYVEDYIVHWDCGTGLSKGKKSIKAAFYHELIDLFLSAVFILIVFQRAQLMPINWLAWWGAFWALVPDFLEAPRNFLRIEFPWLSPLNRFHKLFHNSTPNLILGLTPQLIVLFIVSLLT